MNHESFSASGKLVSSFDFEDQDYFPNPLTSSHGTSCAGLIAAPLDIGRTVGVAPNCRIMPIKKARLSDYTKIAEAFIWAADHGASVISCSFGYDNRPWILPDVVRSVIDYCVEEGRSGKGCVIFWAAGNGNEAISSDEWASYDKVIAVAASTDLDRRAYYSDFGSEVDICAPSSGGHNGIVTTSIGGYTSDFGGTSAAAPIAAGVAALLISVNPNLTWVEVRDLLYKSADKIDGAVNYNSLGHSDQYGYGRVNAMRAIDAISVIGEAIRGSGIADNLDLVYRFAEKYLSSPSGQQITELLKQNKFKILKLLIDDEIFRSKLLSLLELIIHIIEAQDGGPEVQLPEDTVDMITSLVLRIQTVPL
jgi:subtilisin family serine protease